MLEERSSWELLWSTWIIAFFCTLHSIALIFLSLFSCLTLTLSPALWFLALAGHAAAARLCGSLGFMVAALPLCNDGLVNSGVERHSLRQPTAASDTQYPAALSQLQGCTTV